MTICLPERCDRATATAMLPEFLAAIGEEPIAIDASQVTQLGQAMLQLLVSARRTGAGAVIAPSPALRETVALAGLEQEIFGEYEQ